MAETTALRVPTEREAAIISALFGDAQGNFSQAVKMVTGAEFSAQIANKIKNSAPVRAAVREVFDSVGLSDEILVLKLMQLLTAKIKKYNKAAEVFEDCDDNATQFKALKLCMELKGLTSDEVLDGAEEEDQEIFCDGDVVSENEIQESRDKAEAKMREMRAG